MLEKFKSRKFILTVVGGIVVLINAMLEANGKKAMDTETVLAFAGLLATYVLGESHVDANRKPGAFPPTSPDSDK